MVSHSKESCPGRGEDSMDRTSKKTDKSTWAIGGTTLIGIGVGFIFLRVSPLFFVASILIGIGLGLVITSLISREKGKNSS
jgi:hypothetical protein